MFLDILIGVALSSAGVGVYNGAHPASSSRPQSKPLRCLVNRGRVHRALLSSQSFVMLPLLTAEINNAQESNR